MLLDGGIYPALRANTIFFGLQSITILGTKEEKCKSLIGREGIIKLPPFELGASCEERYFFLFDTHFNIEIFSTIIFHFAFP
jgi:hypothetical protein